MHAVRTPPSTEAVADRRSTLRTIGSEVRRDEPASVPGRRLLEAVAIWICLGVAGWVSVWVALRFVAGQF